MKEDRCKYIGMLHILLIYIYWNIACLWVWYKIPGTWGSMLFNIVIYWRLFAWCQSMSKACGPSLRVIECNSRKPRVLRVPENRTRGTRGNLIWGRTYRFMHIQRICIVLESEAQASRKLRASSMNMIAIS